MPEPARCGCGRGGKEVGLTSLRFTSWCIPKPAACRRSKKARYAHCLPRAIDDDRGFGGAYGGFHGALAQHRTCASNWQELLVQRQQRIRNFTEGLGRTARGLTVISAYRTNNHDETRCNQYSIPCHRPSGADPAPNTVTHLNPSNVKTGLQPGGFAPGKPVRLACAYRWTAATDGD